MNSCFVVENVIFLIFCYSLRWILNLRIVVLQIENFFFFIMIVGWDGSVGISDSLWAGRFGDRMSVGARFSTQTGPGAYPVSYTMGTVSFPGVKQPGHGVALTTHPHLALRFRERVELYLYSPCGFSWPVLG